MIFRAITIGAVREILREHRDRSVSHRSRDVPRLMRHYSRQVGSTATVNNCQAHGTTPTSSLLPKTAPPSDLTSSCARFKNTSLHTLGCVRKSNPWK